MKGRHSCPLFLAAFASLIGTASTSIYQYINSGGAAGGQALHDSKSTAPARRAAPALSISWSG